MMTGEALKSMQFVVDDKGQPTAVLLDIRAWEMLLKWIETVTDTKIAIQTLQELQQAGGRPERAGWLAWEDIGEAWGDEEEIETPLNIKFGCDPLFMPVASSYPDIYVNE